MFPSLGRKSDRDTELPAPTGSHLSKGCSAPIKPLPPARSSGASKAMPSEFRSDSGGNKNKHTSEGLGARGQQHLGVVEGGSGRRCRAYHRQMGRAEWKLWSVSSLRGVAESGVGN